MAKYKCNRCSDNSCSIDIKRNDVTPDDDCLLNSIVIAKWVKVSPSRKGRRVKK